MAVFALTCLAFWSQAQLGELLFHRDFNPGLHIAHENILFGIISDGWNFGKCWAPHTKTKPGGDWLLFTDSEGHAAHFSL